MGVVNGCGFTRGFVAGELVSEGVYIVPRRLIYLAEGRYVGEGELFVAEAVV